MKKILLVILSVSLMGFGIYGIVVWWWPLFVQLFLGLIGFVIFLAGLILFLRARNSE